MPSAIPFAGPTVPAEGVSFWLAGFLSSATLEAGLVSLMQWLEETLECGPLAIWVWPEPHLEVIGLVGHSRFHDIQRRPLGKGLPDQRDLIEWSTRDNLVEGDVTWLTSPPESRVAEQRSHEIDRSSVDPGNGPIAALLLPRSTQRLSPEEQLWLATLINWLITRERVLRDARLASLAEFAAGAGHEINNPLGTILGRSQLLQRREENPERRRALQAIGGQALRIRDMISDMMVYARPPIPHRRPVDVLPLIESVIDRFGEDLRAAGIRLDRKLSAVIVDLDAEQFQVVVIELLRNAIRAVGRKGCIGIRTRVREWRESRWMELDLYNNGPELTTAEKCHAFDPFFSGRDAGRGLGFGLTKCWRIMELHGGRIGVVSSPGQTVFRTLWPIS